MIPESKKDMEEQPAGKDDATNGFSEDAGKDQKADKIPGNVPEDSSSQSSVPEKSEIGMDYTSNFKICRQNRE